MARTKTSTKTTSAVSASTEPASSPLPASGLSKAESLIQEVNALASPAKRGPGRPKKIVAAQPSSLPIKEVPQDSDTAKVRSRRNRYEEVEQEPTSEFDVVEPDDALDLDSVEDPSTPWPHAEATEETTEPAEEQWPQYLLQAALQSGVDHNDFVSPAALTKYLIRQANQPQPMQAPVHQPAPEPPKAFDPFEGEEADAFDAPTKALIGKVVSHFENKLSRAEQAANAIQNSASEQNELAVDGVFSELDKEFPGVFGSGRARGMYPNHPSLNNRQQIFGLASAWAQKTGEAFDSNLLRKIAAIQFGAPKNAPNKPDPIAQRRSQHVAAPTARTNPKLSAEEQGVAFIENFKKSHS